MWRIWLHRCKALTILLAGLVSFFPFFLSWFGQKRRCPDQNNYGLSGIVSSQTVKLFAWMTASTMWMWMHAFMHGCYVSYLVRQPSSLALECWSNLLPRGLICQDMHSHHLALWKPYLVGEEDWTEYPTVHASWRSYLGWRSKCAYCLVLCALLLCSRSTTSDRDFTAGSTLPPSRTDFEPVQPNRQWWEFTLVPVLIN